MKLKYSLYSLNQYICDLFIFPKLNIISAVTVMDLEVIRFWQKEKLWKNL